MAKSYRDLEVYQISMKLFIRVHQVSLRLPKYEMYELGSQVRRSADSVNSNIVEGYGRRRYKKDFIKFLIYSHSSNDETINHLKKLKILYPKFDTSLGMLIDEYEILGAKLNRFITYITQNWRD